MLGSEYKEAGDCHFGEGLVIAVVAPSHVGVMKLGMCLGVRMLQISRVGDFQEHNDLVMCCKDVVDEDLKRKSGDNFAAAVVCFQPHPPPKSQLDRSTLKSQV
ncbi:hypothetical protein NL676_034008 [Syzygium grande]|nr:hypothetical protein NL676_034008 [Syzygium grande]